jgi:hypothetical protein
MMLDELEKGYYGQAVKIACYEKHGTEFQSFFEKFMLMNHGDDFVCVRPHGNTGDRKCDGYLQSEKIVFQCYAPELPLAQTETISKINEDFNGAKKHWIEMIAWKFVTNKHAIPPDVLSHLNKLEKDHNPITVRLFTYETMREIILSLPKDRLIELFGAMPTSQQMQQLTFNDIKPVLDHLQKNKPDPNYPVNAPSLEKLKANGLSEDVEVLLRHGRLKEPLVEQFFNGYPDPDFGEQIAQSYREYYQVLKSQNLPSDDIFRALQVFTGGQERSLPVREAAILAVMSYFFERCDIFEDVKEAI